jgi:hypothetical protein
MNHVVSTLRDSVQVSVPILGVFSHEFGQTSYHGDGVEGQQGTLQFESRRNIDVVNFRGGWFGYGDVVRCIFGHGRVADIVAEGPSLVDREIDGNVFGEVWRQPTGVSASQTREISTYLCSL